MKHTDYKCGKYYNANMKNYFIFILTLFFCLNHETIAVEITGKVNNTIDIPPDKQDCSCSWSQWMSASQPSGSGESETYSQLRNKGYDICKAPVAIQCYNLANDNLVLGYTAVCNVNLGLTCSLFCDDYAIRVACCYCPPEATGPEFQITPSSGSGGCLKATPILPSSSVSSVSMAKACDFKDKSQLWVWVSKYSLKNIKTQQCLAVSNNTIVVENCEPGTKNQRWRHYDRLSALQQYGSKNYIKRQGDKVYLGTSKGSDSMWLAKVPEGKTSMKNMKNFECDPPLSVPENGNLTCTLGRYVSSECTFHCNHGYRLPEDTENPSECMDDGLFTVDTPPCEKILCKPEISPIQHGAVTCSNANNLGSSCVYKCDAGYALIGNSEITCTKTDEWTSEPPTCKRIVCSPNLELEGITDGTVNCTNSFYSGSKCTYTCAQGYELLGPNTRICQLTEEWDTSKPVCQKIRCQEIVASKNSKMTCSDGVNYMSTCKFQCNEGYTMVGSGTSVCTAEETWGSEPPECERKTCTLLERPENGDMNCDDDNFYGSHCKFECDRGFKIEGENSLQCTDEGWNLGAPRCTQITCSRLTNPINGAVSCSKNELFDSVCEYTCSQGFKLKGSSSCKCTDEGWDSEPPVCEQITCEALPSVKNGRTYCSKDNIYDSACFVICNTGYDLPSGVQPIPVTCQEDGTWSSSPAMCKRIQCRLNNIEHGLLTCSDLNNFNSTCTFDCKAGYNLHGMKQATCTKSGWDAQTPSCAKRTCSPPLAQPSFGKIECHSKKGYPICVFSCNAGYQLIGSDQSECRKDETWTVTEVPICKIKECPSKPKSPEHGNMSCTIGSTYNSVCSFHCEKGYHLVGERQTTCTEDKMWDHETPTCEKISCSKIETPNGGGMICTNNFFYKSKCSFTCKSGYDLKGFEETECYHNSTWSSSAPICERITCKESLNNPSNGRVVCSDDTNFDSKCVFSCEDGFSLEGAKESYCRRTGWSVKEPPMCKKITCPIDDEGLSNGATSCNHGNDYKSICKYSCNKGFELKGTKTVICEDTGNWSSKKPICKEIQCPEIPNLKHGQVVCREKNFYNSECKFVCNDGYILVPNIETVRCMENRRWNPAGSPVCDIENKTLPVTQPITMPPNTTTTKATTTARNTTPTTTTKSTTTTIKTSPETTSIDVIVPKQATEPPTNQVSVPKSESPPKVVVPATTNAVVIDKTPTSTPRFDYNNEVTFSPKDPSEQEKGFPIAIVAAVAGVVVVLTIILVLVFVLRKKKSKSKPSYGNGHQTSVKMNNRYDAELGPLLSNGTSSNGAKKYGVISMDRLEAEYNRRHADDDKLFREEYQSLVDGTGAKEVGGRVKNKDKNRYTNILPFDHSRVTLPKIGIDGDSDYINASFVDGYKHKGKFIAAQGPKENTIMDFWRMIWEQNVTTVIMATNLEERKEPKCAQYWPQGGSQTYGDLTVSFVEENLLVDYAIRSFTVQRVNSTSTMSSKRNVTQYHFTSWPDFGVPKSPSGILKFLRKIKHGSPTGYGPIVVHCSAGVGRTGTFICIDAMMDMISRENKIDVFGFCQQMRQQRPEMVQTDQQYIFIYQAVLEHHLYGDTEVEATEVSAHIDDLMQRLPGNVTGMEHEFRKLTSIRIQKEHMRAGNHPANMRKNRVLLILPYDWNRVMLQIKRGQENTDYINASHIDGYRQKDAYIATQGPLPLTMEDFWRMIWDSQSASIVMLTELVERGQAKCAQYWPEKGVNTFGDIEVEMLSTLEHEDYSERDFKVCNKMSSTAKELIVKQFHYHGWPEVGAPVSGYSMIELVEAVQKQQQNSGNHPIVIHCSAGAGRTGAFCALTTALEQVKAEGVIDMFQIVKCLRMQRPHMVQNLEQYEFCYRAVQEYIDSMSEYYNFK